MNILYVTDEVNSPINRNLCKAIVDGNQDFEITLFCINIHKKETHGNLFKTKNIEELNIDANYNYIYQRVNFYYKKKHKLKLLEESINIKKYDIVYASTLFADGAVAYEIYKKYDIPYIVAVRGTDVNLYLKKMFHLWNLGKNILQNASQIICISQNIKKKVEASWSFKKSWSELNLTVITNGIDNFWIDNAKICKSSDVFFKFLYIGHLDENKNVKSLVKSFLKVRLNNNNVSLTIIGSGGKHEEYIKNVSSKNCGIIYLGPIYDKNRLLNIVREHQGFIMVSYSETFGLVYLEALSQGLPVIYSKGQGIDGMFPHLIIGESVDSKSINDISEAIIKVSDKLTLYDNILNEIDNFRWSNIGKIVSKIIIKSISDGKA